MIDYLAIKRARERRDRWIERAIAAVCIAIIALAILAGIIAIDAIQSADAGQTSWGSETVWPKLGDPASPLDENAVQMDVDADQFPDPPTGVVWVIRESGAIWIWTNDGTGFPLQVQPGDQVQENDVLVVHKRP